MGEGRRGGLRKIKSNNGTAKWQHTKRPTKKRQQRWPRNDTKTPEAPAQRRKERLRMQPETTSQRSLPLQSQKTPSSPSTRPRKKKKRSNFMTHEFCLRKVLETSRGEKCKRSSLLQTNRHTSTNVRAHRQLTTDIQERNEHTHTHTSLLPPQPERGNSLESRMAFSH